MTTTADSRAQFDRRDAMERAGLTRREIDVLESLSRGLTNAQIGRELYLTETTVKSHLRTLFRKLEVNDRAHAVATGFRKGWLA